HPPLALAVTIEEEAPPRHDVAEAVAQVQVELLVPRQEVGTERRLRPQVVGALDRARAGGLRRLDRGLAGRGGGGGEDDRDGAGGGRGGAGGGGAVWAPAAPPTPAASSPSAPNGRRAGPRG